MGQLNWLFMPSEILRIASLYFLCCEIGRHSDIGEILFQDKQDSIPVGCVPPACQPYGEGGYGPGGTVPGVWSH